MMQGISDGVSSDHLRDEDDKKESKHENRYGSTNINGSTAGTAATKLSVKLNEDTAGGPREYKYRESVRDQSIR